ncbi:hypothetical protein NC99_02360 [Sunxiuqinia dokdonensis]|uniref:Uncharacterized protein n=1 Tax=Sunxiuqinia dokdonensis TaxID=1409788 RepID=A0A0L8VFJ4_9BACT|nr:hypothetical protein NC99_02360 [Sunxiuqinia dokdonensis]
MDYKLKYAGLAGVFVKTWPMNRTSMQINYFFPNSPIPGRAVGCGF